MIILRLLLVKSVLQMSVLSFSCALCIIDQSSQVGIGTRNLTGEFHDKCKLQKSFNDSLSRLKVDCCMIHFCAVFFLHFQCKSKLQPYILVINSVSLEIKSSCAIVMEYFIKCW